MTETRTPRLDLPQWSSDETDSPSREDFTTAFLRLEERAAYDDGSSVSSLPAAGPNARYLRRSYSDGWALYRSTASAWEWAGGTVAPETVRHRAANDAAVVLAVDQGSDASRKLTIYGDGGVATLAAVRSYLGAIGHDLGTALNPATLGRLSVRTRADGERGVVAIAHGDGAGNLITAREVGGSDPWVVDSRGRMRAAAAAAFGSASPTTNVAVVSVPNVADVTAMDLYGATTPDTKSALRAFREISDSAAILDVQPSSIKLGRASWAGASIELRAPTLTLVGALGLTGALTATSVASGPLTTFGNVPVVVTASLASITSPTTDMWALLTTDYVWYRYNGSAWTAMQPARGGATTGTRHDARYVQAANQTITSTASTFTPIQFATVETDSSDVTASGTGNSIFTLNRSGLWTIQAACSYNGNPGLGRRVMIITDTADASAKFFAGDSTFPEADASCQLSATVQKRFTAGQTVRVITFQDSGNSIALSSARDAGNVSFKWDGS